MSTIEGIFSTRLVTADFYLEKPCSGLDPCYSELRGREIKKVPIIRIFGPNSNGQKTCVHVHGVFPYFYIPYEKKDFETLERGIFQVATHLDKAINVSLGQASGNAQHVFKIHLVKGIPFYGYHRSEHQFLKIYMFNPRFVRRAANLLQNGAILNKTFNPHESHVPYILQFMIDYNLYGMSFLHVPAEVVKFRRNSVEECVPYPDVLPAQLLDTMAYKKISCSELEVDIASSFILNRFQLVTKTNNLHTNPGIEAIWQDERLRRQKLAESITDEDKLNAIPALEVPPTQERPNVEIAESEIFYRTALVSKLLVMENSIMCSGSMADQTMNATLLATTMQETNNTLNITNANKEQRRTFNLKKLLANAVYPDECTQEDRLVNASFIENHLSSSNAFQSSGLSQAKHESNEQQNASEDVFSDETIVDEELVLSLTQPHIPLDATLREEDLLLLDVLQQLEEQNTAENHIDLDSSLAPLSQHHEQIEFTPEILDKETMAAAANLPISTSDSENENEEDGDNILDFSMAMDDIDELLLKITQSQTQPNSPKDHDDKQEKVPQIDGSDDRLQHTPKKNIQTNIGQQRTPPRTPTTPKQRLTSTYKTPTRSPRTPKRDLSGRYAPLALVYSNKSGQKTTPSANNTTPTKPTSSAATRIGSPFETKPSQKPTVSLRKRLALTELRRKSISVPKEDCIVPVSKNEVELSEKPAVRRSRRTIANLDKTHITCSLKPVKKSEHKLKVYTPSKESTLVTKTPENTTENCPPAVPRTRRSLRNQLESNKEPNTAPTLNLENLVTKKHEKPTDFCSPAVRKTRQSLRNQQESSKAPASAPTTRRKSVRVKLCNSKEIDDCFIPNTTKQTSEEATKQSIAKLCKKVRVRVKKMKLSQIKKQESASEDEIIVSDTETDASAIRLAKTPNLRRLRRSFQGSTLTKRMSTNRKRSDRSRESSHFAKPRTINYEIDTPKKQVEPASEAKSPWNSPSQIASPNENEHTLMQSFYEHSFIVNSPSMFSEDAPSPLFPPNCRANKTPTISDNSMKTSATLTEPSNSINSSFDGKVRVTPLDLPPTYEEALEGCEKFGIHEYEFQQPFYSNPDDITKMKEVGFTVLHIQGNKLNDCPEFESLLVGDNVTSLKDWRRQQLVDIGGPMMTNRYRNAAQVREYFSTCTKVAIEPQAAAPSRQEAKVWLKARELLKQKGQVDVHEEKRLAEDSPIKIRRQKVTMMLNEDGAEGDSDGDDLDCSSARLTLTPMTPGTPLHISKDNTSFTPLTSNSRESSVFGQRRTARRAKMSLSRKLNLAKSDTKASNKIQCVASEQLLASSSSDRDELPVSQESLKLSQTSESSISSQAALAELERSSFVRQLQQSSGQHDVSFGLTHATLNNTFGFKVNLENLEQAKADIEFNYLTTMSLELFVPTRENLHPDPMHDELRCLFYAIEHSIPNASDAQKSGLPTKACGYIIVNDHEDIVSEGRVHGIDADIDVCVVKNEIEAIEALLQLIARWDPDIYAGYEIEMSSWGYVIDRAKYLCFNIVPMLSRVPTQKVREFVDEDRDQYTDLDFEMKICGRILLDVWRLMRSEIALTSYTFENVMYHILHKRCPWHSYRSLTDWFASPCSRWIVLEYYLERVRGTMAILHQLDLIGRTSEMAKLIGIQFYEVLSRGSQFRVESMMLRIAKPKNLVPLSPSVQQRAHARAPEYLALIMEPESRFYADPLIVLDFQSLYPSMIIAYNYCFSTCLGRVEHLGQSTPFEFGASQLRVSPVMLKKLLDRDLVTVSPCGVVFVKPSVREGILPRMLTEILDTRQMVKQSMKLHKHNSALQRILHSRQLGLKLMANVTYGYTAANFSGRMPSVEVGDTIVAKARETLERAIKLVEANDKWNVRVVYGDTDSMFVLVPGRNREQAFKIGEEIADAVTKQNPHPVKLKLEKVYQPCILQTKKRYVGYMYETADQAEPVYEAKGIETVRRDGCPAVAKMLEKVLRILFETADVSQVKQYVCRQFTKLLSGRANLQDLIFAKEFRGLNGYKPTACVPALEMTRKWLQADPRHIPRRGERVPFIIINGPPGVPLIRLVRSPHELLSDEGYKINAIYYITKAIIPPLNRCLLLIGADANEWFTNLPRKILLTPALSNASELKAKNKNSNQLKKSTISQYFSNTNCVIDCGRQTKQGICSVCVADAMKCFATLQSKIAKCERGYQLTQQICQACCGRVGDLNCASLDCPVLYVLEVKRRELQQTEHFRQLLDTRF